MMTVIDNLNSTTGWTVSGTAVVHGLCTTQGFIAGDLTASLIFRFLAAGDYVQKVFSTPLPTAGDQYLTLSIKAMYYGKDDYRSFNDFEYGIDFGTGKKYYLPAGPDFVDVSFDISDLTTIDRIRITALGDTPDYLIVSYCVRHTDEMPLDIFKALKTKIDARVAAKYSTRFLCGAIGVTAYGATSIVFTADPSWIRRYSYIKITDGVNTEYHHVRDINVPQKRIIFTSYFDGTSMKYAYPSGASVYVIPACTYGTYESEIIVPSINIWGLAPEVIDIENDIQYDDDTWKTDGSVNEQRTGKWFKYDLAIDCESWSMEIAAELSNIVKNILSQRSIWVNGKKCDVKQSGPPAIVEPNEVVANLPKIQYSASINVKEDIWDKLRVSMASTDTRTYTIRSN